MKQITAQKVVTAIAAEVAVVGLETYLEEQLAIEIAHRLRAEKLIDFSFEEKDGKKIAHAELMVMPEEEFKYIFRILDRIAKFYNAQKPVEAIKHTLLYGTPETPE